MYKGVLFSWWDSCVFSRVKYEDYDSLVWIYNYIGDEPIDYIFKVIIYNINTGAYYEEFVEATTDMNPDIYGIDWQCASPAFYKSKLIYTYTIETSSNLPGPPYGSHSLFASLIIDVVTNTITRVDNYKWDLDVDWVYVTTYSSTGMVDYTTGKYYFTYYMQSGLSPYTDMDRLCSIDLNSDSYSLTDVVDMVDFGWTGWQSETYPYMVNGFYDTPITCDIYQIPSLDTHGSIDYMYYRPYCSCIIDTRKNIFWNVKGNILQGIGVLGAEGRDISIAWGDIPFSYSNYRHVFLQILDGIAVITVWSQTGSSYQKDCYLLK